MAEKRILVDLDLNQQQIKNFSVELLAADPVSPFEGQEWINTTDNARRIFVNGEVRTLASQADITAQINSLGRSQGSFDANPGALPVASDKTAGDLAALVSGDFWIITNAGTIAGIQGDDELSAGDKIQYISGDPTVASNWVGVQTNLNDGNLGNGADTDSQVVNLVAGTGLTVSSSTVANIRSVEVYNSAGEKIVVCVELGANPNQRVLTSNVNLTGVRVDLLG